MYDQLEKLARLNKVLTYEVDDLTGEERLVVQNKEGSIDEYIAYPLREGVIHMGHWHQIEYEPTYNDYQDPLDYITTRSRSKNEP